MTVFIPKDWNRENIEKFIRECESKGGRAIVTVKANAKDFVTNTDTEIELDRGFAILTCNVNGKNIDSILLFNVPPEVYEMLKQNKSIDANELLK